jgi:hypothetical protein
MRRSATGTVISSEIVNFQWRFPETHCLYGETPDPKIRYSYL